MLALAPKPQTSFAKIENIVSLNRAFDDTRYSPNKHNSILLLPPEGACKFIYAKDIYDNHYVCALPRELANFHRNIKNWLEHRLLRGLKVEGGGYVEVTADGKVTLSGSSKDYGQANFSNVIHTLHTTHPTLVITNSQHPKIEQSASDSNVLPVMTYLPPRHQYKTITISNDFLAKAILRAERFFKSNHSGLDWIKEDMGELQELNRMMKISHLQNLSGLDLQAEADRRYLSIDRKIAELSSYENDSVSARQGILPKVVGFTHIGEGFVESQIDKLRIKSGVWFGISHDAKQHPEAPLRLLVAKRIVALKNELKHEASASLEILRDRLWGES